MRKWLALCAITALILWEAERCGTAGIVLSGNTRGGTRTAMSNSPVLKTLASITRRRTVSFGLDRIDQREPAPDGLYMRSGSGRGVTVYVFDAGISTNHPELSERVRTGFIAFPDDEPICNGHGTAVAGAIAGKTLGVAPEAEIVDVKAISCKEIRGSGLNAIIQASNWVIEDHSLHPGPAVVNWSFIVDTSTHIHAIDSAIHALRQAGLTVVVSAGNVATDACHISPSNAWGAVVVGGLTLTTEKLPNGTTRLVDERTPGTAYGPCIELYAPGDSVLLPGLEKGDKPITQLWNGTSMSAAYVSGAAALYLETHPKASPDEVTEALLESATVVSLKGSDVSSARILYVRDLANFEVTQR